MPRTPPFQGTYEDYKKAYPSPRIGYVEYLRDTGQYHPLQAKDASGHEHYQRTLDYYATVNRLSRQVARRDPVFKFWYKVLSDQRALAEKGKADLTPGGSYARALVGLGYRDPRSQFNVGETPKVRDIHRHGLGQPMGKTTRKRRGAK